ncbi:MAG: hypothetical protein V1789_03135 [PVC group bacterium]
MGHFCRPAAADCPLRLWGLGRPRALGRVEVTGKPGDDYYREVGPWAYWYRNGRKMMEGEFRDGDRVGEWSYWYNNGIREKKGSFDEYGRRTGFWKFWYKNGLDWKEGWYEAGVENGPWTYRYDDRDGQNRQEGRYARGKPDGPWTYWYENGRKRREGEYRNGWENGRWRSWYEDGRLKCEGDFADGLETGEWTYREPVDEDEGGELREWSYYFRTDVVPGKERAVQTPAAALVGHWISENTISSFEGSRSRGKNLQHIYFTGEGRFKEVMGGKLYDAGYTVEDEDPAARTIRVLIIDANGRGAVFFGRFTENYGGLAGRYYLVELLRGSRGKLDNYFMLFYAGKETGPSPPDIPAQ